MTVQKIVQDLVEEIEASYRLYTQMNRKLGEERARPYWREYNTLLNFARKIGCEKIWDEKMREIGRRENEVG